MTQPQEPTSTVQPWAGQVPAQPAQTVMPLTQRWRAKHVHRLGVGPVRPVDQVVLAEHRHAGHLRLLGRAPAGPVEVGEHGLRLITT